MNDSAMRVPLQHYMAVLRRYRLMIISVVVLAACGAVAYSAASDVTYTSVATVGFTDQSQDLQALGTAAAPSQTPDKQAAAQAQTINSLAVAERVRAQLRLTQSPSKLQDAIATEVQPADNLVAITATWSNAKGAADIANAFAKQSRDLVTEQMRERYTTAARALQKRIRKLSTTKIEDQTTRVAYTDQVTRLVSLAQFSRPVEIVKSASQPGAPASPKPVRNTILAMILGLVIAIALAFARHALDRRLRDVAEVRDEMAMPLLGYVGRPTLGRGPLPVGNRKPLSDEELEPFRIMRTNLGFLAIDEPPKTVIVTSPLPEEGKSTVSTCLAYAEAMAGRRTLLVDCDMRRPSVAERFGLQAGPGLSDYLRGRATPSEILQTVQLAPARSSEGAETLSSELVCITAGSPVANPAELLGSERFRTFVEQVSGVYDQVIIDSPPLLPVGDALEMVPHVGAVLLCLRIGQTTRDQAIAAKSAIAHLPSRPIGIVATAVTSGSDAGTAGYYAYSHSYASSGAAA